MKIKIKRERKCNWRKARSVLHDYRAHQLGQCGGRTGKQSLVRRKWHRRMCRRAEKLGYPVNSMVVGYLFLGMSVKAHIGYPNKIKTHTQNIELSHKRSILLGEDERDWWY